MAAPADLEVVPFNPDIHDISAFDCNDADLNDFLRSDAIPYQEQHLSWTCVARSNDKVCAYITLLTDSIILKTPEKKSWLPFHTQVMFFPALKIGRLGVAKECQGQSIGTELLKHAIGLAVALNSDLRIGCRFLTVDAYPRSVEWYLQKGFVFNKHYKKPERTHPSLRYDILKGPIIQ